MNTTLLFAELLIIGLQTSLWTFLLVLNVFGNSWFQVLQSTGLYNWQAVIIILLLSIFYVLGIIIDRLADLVFSRWDRRIADKIIPHPPWPISVMRFELGRDNEYLNRQFEYTRSRMRIARASSLNFGASTILVMLLILTRLQSTSATERWEYFIFTSIIGVLLTVAAIYSWHKLTRTYFGLVKANYELYNAKQVESSTPFSS